MTGPVGEAPAVASAELRAWLAPIADALIPAGKTMPSASEVDVAGKQLDLVLRARPDLLPELEAARQATATTSPGAVLDALPAGGALREALLLTVAGAYYTQETVRERLGYTGQMPVPVRADTYGEYLDAGLLDRVIERGAIYRPTPVSDEMESKP